jgi:polysaccharide biosynthesis protein VpsQ
VPFAISFVVVAGAIGAADLGWAPGFFVWMDATPFMDKIGHFGLLAGLAFALNWALGARRFRLGPLSPLLGSAIVAVVITIEEISQLWIPKRQFDLTDLTANYVGILFAGWLIRRILR